MKINKICAVASLLALFGTCMTSCNDDKSYSELLRDEEKATNWYMANQRIELEIPADSIFQVGEDAPFYKMDDDGYIYMQVIDAGDDRKPMKGDLVYFRFARKNLNYMYAGSTVNWEGNLYNLNSPTGNTSFIFDDMAVTSSSTYGQGIQTPLKFLGYNSEVNLVIRSYYGFNVDQSQCLAYIYKVKYYKPEY